MKSCRLTLVTCAVFAALVTCQATSLNIDTICGIDTSSELVDKLENARSVATNWLSNSRKPHFGWSLGNTAAAVTSLQLVNQSWIAETSLEMRLTLKELQLEILSVLSRAERILIPNSNHLTDHHRLMISRLPYYVMALHATCHNNTDYHGIDLISLLSDNMRRFRKDVQNDYYQHAHGVLAMCSTGHPVNWRYIDDLLRGQRPDGCFHKQCAGTCTNERIDTTSMVLSAFACVHNTTYSTHRDKLSQGIERATDCLLNSYESHGSFGNTINNALATRALLSAGVNHSRWDCHAIMTSVVGDMHVDGHYGNLAATIYILPLLAGRHHSHIKETDFECPQDYFESHKPSLQTILPNEETISVLLEIEDFTGYRPIPYQLEGAIGESLWVLMHRVQQSGVNFTFQSKTTEWGEYITSINGIENDQGGYRNWIIERIVGKLPQCIDKGAGDIIPENGDNYKWVYRGCTSDNDLRI